MNKIGFSIGNAEPENDKIVDICPKTSTNEKMTFKKFMKSEEYQSALNSSIEGGKIIAEIGNGVLVGSLWAICTCFPVVGIPLKICAAVSCAALHGVLTQKTNEAFDSVKKASDELADILED